MKHKSKRKSWLDSIEVPAPCPQSWDEMTGDDKVRLCHQCDRNIHNLSEMKPREVRKLLFESKEKVCIRMERTPDGRIKTLKKQFHQITRQMPLAAGVLTASLILSAAINGQERSEPHETGKITITQTAKSAASKPTISGTVTDQNGAVVPGVKIILRDTKNNLRLSAVSNDDGVYEFKDIAPSVYEIEIAEDRGFKRFNYQNLTVDGTKDLNITIILEASSTTDTDFNTDNFPNLTTEQTPISDKISQRQIENLPLQSRNLPVLGLFPGAIKSSQKTSQISFTIYYEDREIIPGAKVELTNQKNNKQFIVNSNNAGIAQFNSIPHGTYDVEVSVSGFNSYKQTVQIKEPVEPNMNIELNLGAAIGIFVVDWHEIPFFQAIAQNDIEAVKTLIASKININTKDKYGKTALHVAVEHENLELVKTLINSGAKVNAKDKHGRTPILSIEDSFEILYLLVKKGADINVQDKIEGKMSLLMSACENNNLEGAKFLLEAGANPNLKNKEGQTAFDLTDKAEIKQLLKKYGAKN